MPTSAAITFADPYEYQFALRAADVRVFVSAAGDYRADLTWIDLHRLWMQRSRMALPSVIHCKLFNERRVVFFPASSQQAPTHHSGIAVSPGELMFNAPASEHYYRTPADCHWAAMSLTPEDLARAGRALVGREVAAPNKTQLIRPPPRLMSRLMRLHEAAGHLAVDSPEILAHPEVAKAIGHLE